MRSGVIERFRRQRSVTHSKRSSRNKKKSNQRLTPHLIPSSQVFRPNEHRRLVECVCSHLYHICLWISTLSRSASLNRTRLPRRYRGWRDCRPQAPFNHSGEQTVQSLAVKFSRQKKKSKSNRAKGREVGGGSCEGRHC